MFNHTTLKVIFAVFPSTNYEDIHSMAIVTCYVPYGILNTKRCYAHKFKIKKNRIELPDFIVVLKTLLIFTYLAKYCN